MAPFLRFFLKSGALCLLIGPALGFAGDLRAPGKPGGALVLAANSEPKTLNPLLAGDQPSRDVIYALSADLVHINRATLSTEPALAKNWTVSRDGRHYTLALRPGLRFSDGAPLTADDVVFTFRAHLDPAVHSMQRDLLLINGQPIVVSKVSSDTVRVDLPAPYAPGERLFDGFWILPSHKLEKAYAEGRLGQVWGVGTAPADLATAGPFRLRQYLPGQRLVMERNPYYWRKDEEGRPLPYLDRLEFVFVADQNAQLLRLLAGEVDAVSRIRPEDFARVEQTPQLRARDAGPSLEYNFLAFNWTGSGRSPGSGLAPPQAWFRNRKFRQAVAHAIDREAMVRLVFGGRGAPIWSQVTEGNRLWRTEKVTHYPYDPARAEQLLREAGFRRDAQGPLRDAEGHSVEFTLMVSSSNQVRGKMATLVQEDLARLGIRAQAMPTEFGAMMDAVLNTRKFEAVVWGFGSGDTDPNNEMNVWTSDGPLHVWNLKTQQGPPPAVEPWEAEVDRLMHAQMTLTAVRQRKAVYDRVQQLVSENLPLIFLVSPHVLSAGNAGLGNFEPAILEPFLLWNCDRLFWSRPRR